MFNKFKKYITSKKSTCGFRNYAEQEGVSLRDLTREEVNRVNWGMFARKLIDVGALPRDYALVYNLTEVCMQDKTSDNVSHINLTFRSFKNPKDIHVNIKSLSVSCAKGDSLVYQHNKKMTEAWVDMCYAVLWAKKFAGRRTDLTQDEYMEK